MVKKKHTENQGRGMKGKHHSEETKRKISEKRKGGIKSPNAYSFPKGKENPNFNNNQINNEGYVWIKSDILELNRQKGYAKRCNVVWYEKTGEIIKEPYFLHHKDENKRNDVFDNLEKVTRRSHAKKHLKERNKEGKFLKVKGGKKK
jgi:hypothetical protein